MFVTVKFNQDIQDGTLVCHDNQNYWRVATSTDASLGVVNNVVQDEYGQFWGRVTLAGCAFARASAFITIEGGFLRSDDLGRVVVSNEESSGIVAPVSRGSSLPNVDDLILIHIR